MSDGDGFSASSSSNTTAQTIDPKKINSYSGGEGRFMDWSQNLRGKWLDPLLRSLAESGIRADHITFLSLATGLIFCPVFLWGPKLVAFTFLLLHVLLDGLDGPLARYTGQDSNSGSFTDTMADQLVVAASTVTMIHAGHAGAWPGGLYVFFYTVVVAFALARNALCKPYSWLFRPRFFVFAWFVVETYWLPGKLDWVLWLATAILAMKCITGFLAIRRRL